MVDDMGNDESESEVADVEAVEGTRTCPVCGTLMEQQLYKNLVRIEVCEQHGVWLDNGELETILAARAGRAMRRLRLHKRLEYNRGRRDLRASLFWCLLN